LQKKYFKPRVRTYTRARAHKRAHTSTFPGKS